MEFQFPKGVECHLVGLNLVHRNPCGLPSQQKRAPLARSVLRPSPSMPFPHHPLLCKGLCRLDVSFHPGDSYQGCIGQTHFRVTVFEPSSPLGQDCSIREHIRFRDPRSLVTVSCTDSFFNKCLVDIYGQTLCQTYSRTDFPVYPLPGSFLPACFVRLGSTSRTSGESQAWRQASGSLSPLGLGRPSLIRGFSDTFIMSHCFLHMRSDN